MHGPSDGSLDLPASMRARHEVEVEAAEEGEEPVDGPAKRTRAQVSLAELTWEELDTFLQVGKSEGEVWGSPEVA